MQQEAIRRVRQMQQRARRTLEDAGMHIEPPSAQLAEPEPGNPVHETGTVDSGPEAASAPVGFFPNPAPSWREPPPKPDPPEPVNPPHHQGIPKPIFNFSIDNEQLIILGLLFLLYQDKADNLLMLALVYILL